ncbi:OmpH family outer membrane protein [Aliidiomarina maris]|uniref:Molecular chaperone n=1 Tax=Aliidiomarina maris TaxID=531312 RepID=A0A327WW85_9GAMM|nr:OmpH family outer membrane protein [Aliidiomarina maris]MBA3988097.1 molecular chaperone [Idiomarina sp.]MCL4409744.1 OmpH family outer membrane protein [Gammaproteobacteria bacterium]MCL5048941.1 OmpH family outer membrane protein [Bacillota bacterium]RAJ96521.1 periplasmic chaperone for outer membrane proteins Skp [Aliidiomarina maris]RUO23733.1 molecular chaperone [Aliidiomarina maris]
MKSLIKSIFLASVLSAMSLGVSATAAAEAKMAVVDVGAVFQQLPEREEISQNLQREFNDRIERMQRRETEIGQLRDRIQRDEEIMSEEEYTQAMMEFQQRVQEAQQSGQQLNEEMRRRQNEERDRVLRRMQEVIADIAEAEGYDVVLEASGIAYARDGFDISSRVLEAMSSN